MAFDRSELCGAVLDPVEADIFRSSLAIQSYQSLPRESGRGKKRLLFPFVRQVYGKDFEELQTIGDCVGKGLQRVIIYLWCVRIAMLKMQERFPGVPASEVLYALGRHEIGKDKLGKGDGCVVSWAIRGAIDYGILLRQVYDGTDLTTYSGKRARDWGAPKVGLPDNLEAFARLMPLKEAAPIRSWQDGCDAMYNGEPLVWGNNSIYEQRDSDGYLIKTMNGGHCTIVTGYDDSISKPYWLYDNASWPRIPGTRIDDCPPCSGPITRKQVERMLSEGECYAVSDITGMPAQSDELNQLVMI